MDPPDVVGAGGLFYDREPDAPKTQGLSGFMRALLGGISERASFRVGVSAVSPRGSFDKRIRGREEVFMTRFCAGYITMVGATLVTHPLDTLRVRVSVQPDSATYLQTARRVYTADGVRGLYGGFGATLIGAGAAAARLALGCSKRSPYLARYGLFSRILLR